MPMEWGDICLCSDTVVALIEGLGFKRTGPTSYFWEKGTDWIHIVTRPDDGLKVSYNGETIMSVR